MRTREMLGATIIAIALMGGCKKGAGSTDAPRAEGPYGTEPPPPSETTRPREAPTTRPVPSGDAVAKPDARAGEVIIGGSGPGSPGTR